MVAAHLEDSSLESAHLEGLDLLGTHLDEAFSALPIWKELSSSELACGEHARIRAPARTICAEPGSGTFLDLGVDLATVQKMAGGTPPPRPPPATTDKIGACSAALPSCSMCPTRRPGTEPQRWTCVRTSGATGSGWPSCPGDSAGGARRPTSGGERRV
jgi:hypothetical protein